MLRPLHQTGMSEVPTNAASTGSGRNVQGADNRGVYCLGQEYPRYAFGLFVQGGVEGLVLVEA
jgi:hypothetical protein